MATLLRSRRVVLIVSMCSMYSALSVSVLVHLIILIFHSPVSNHLGLNIGGTEASCGMNQNNNYDYPNSSNGSPLPPVIQACYAEEDVIELKVTLTAHHMGHFQYKACPINPGEVASQECFDKNKLIFVEDVLYGSLPDPDHLNRAYIPRHDASFIRKDEMGSYLFSHRFKLPPGLSGQLVLLQWHYITANSCLPDEGYLNYDFPVGFEPKYNLGICKSIPPSGRGVPEQFWNCAEVRISSDCGNEQPASSSSPPSTSTMITKPATKYTDTSTTVAATTTIGATTTTTKVNVSASMTRGDVLSPPPPPLAPSSRRSCPAQNYICGPNNPCENGMCCSQWGYCGITKEYCGECCQSNCGLAPPLPPTLAPVVLADDIDKPPLLVQEVIANNVVQSTATASKASKSSETVAVSTSAVDESVAESNISVFATAASVVSKSSKSAPNMTPIETPIIAEDYDFEETENLKDEYKGEDSSQTQGSNSQGLTRTQVSAAEVYFMTEDEEDDGAVPLWRSLPFIVGFAFLVGVLATLAHLAFEKGRHKKAEKLREGKYDDKQANKDAASLPKKEYIEVYLPDSKQAKQVDAPSQGV